MNDVLAAILAGGAARRFGSDKALAMLGDVALIDRAIAVAQAEADGVVICGRSYPPFAWVADRPRPGLGPLGALAGALRYAAEEGFARVLTLPCDVPFPPTDLRTLLDHGSRGACLAECPVIGFWPSELSAELDAYLERGEDRSMRGWVRSSGAAMVALGRPVENVNSVADLDRLTAAR